MMALQARTKAVDSIERKTGRQVLIDTVETNGVLAKCHWQGQSPLFSLLPRELRDLIWTFATAPTEDETNPYDKTKFFYRPGHTAKLKTDYNILLTCRRAWLEAHPFPMLQAEHSFWYYRAAPDGRSNKWMAALTPLNRKYFGTLHLFAQMFAIEGLPRQPEGIRSYFLPEPAISTEGFQPSCFHVTIRHTDWWYWENEVPLRFEYSWFQAMLNDPGLRRSQVLKLELETLDYKLAQLSPIVEHIKSLESREFDTHYINGRPTSTKFVLTGEPEVTSWTGPANIDGHNHAPYKHKTELKYHVVTLTWRLKFPQYPRGHVPHLRLSPQVNTRSPTVAQFNRATSFEYSRDNDSQSDEGNQRLDAELYGSLDEDFWFGNSESSVDHVQQQRLARMGESRQRSLRIETQESDNIEESMRSSSQVVRDGGTLQAGVNEGSRLGQFRRGMKALREKQWRRRFAEFKSLLRLEDRVEQ